jgi:hypothetical protein
MKLSRLIMFGSAAMFAVSTTWIVSPSPARAQESDQSAVTQASDVWGNRGHRTGIGRLHEEVAEGNAILKVC